MDCHGGTVEKASASDKAGMVETVAPDFKPAGKRKGHVETMSLTIEEQKFSQSVHKDLECVACHADISAVPHKGRLSAVDCGSCHAEVLALYNNSVHGRLTDHGNNKAAVCADCHGSHYILPSKDPNSKTAKANVADTCSKCHLEDQSIADKSAIGDRVPARMYKASIHAKAIKRGNTLSATCNDCHESHNLLPMNDPKSSVFKMNIGRTCGKCHLREASDYNDSIHGVALARGMFDSPSCNDCHGEHGVVATTDPRSSVYKGSISTVTCSSCHSQERIIRKYGLASERFQTYEDSFHGLADKLGDTTVANCASCHGIHNIYPSSDPRSTVNPSNLPSTCGSCHPRMNAGVLGRIHGETTGSVGYKINTTIKWIYYFLIAGTIGFMVFHNFIDWLKKFREMLAMKSGQVAYTRLDLNERMMHLLLMLTFITLVITGFMLVFHVPLPFMAGTDSQKFRAVAHRLAAFGFIVWCVWHTLYLLFTRRGHSWAVSMIPGKKDLRDAIRYVRYNLGLEKTKPSFERFSYIEKAEYIALVWGTIIMILTGFVLWFKEYFARWLPFWGFEVTTTIHFMEAVLATLSIIAWHLYFVLFNPDVGPMATWWLTGMMTEEEMHHEHPLELEKLKQRPDDPAVSEIPQKE